MIIKWTVSNFKSIVKETELTLAPLTLFAGPNSSGKSAILQSLLLVSQTLAHKVSSRSVVLNGTLAKLGQFDDLRSYGGEFDQITIGWECQPRGEAKTYVTDSIRFPEYVSIFGRRSPIKKIDCELSFDSYPGGPEHELYQLQPRLFLFTMSVLARGGDKTDRRYELTIKRTKELESKIADLNVGERDIRNFHDELEYDIVLDQNSLDEIREEFPTAEPVGCALQHFLPNHTLIRVNIVEEIAQHFQMSLIYEMPQYLRRFSPDRELAIPEKLLLRLREKLGEQFKELFLKQSPFYKKRVGMPLFEWIDRTRKLSPDKKRELRRVLSEWTDLQAEMVEALQSARKPAEPEYRVRRCGRPVYLMNASSYLGVFFSDSVQYLGPLRDEPKPLYPLAAHADPTDIGLQGEMTAAVLNLNSERSIRYIPPSAFSDTSFDPKPVNDTLEAAVTDWLEYLGIAVAAHSVDKGKLGHELKVSLSQGGPDHDLTHVGVGVSQVLPILVMSLLAKPDTTLVFEQPELHLHPKVQTRLADFFLSIILMDKQCLIETHSEYLISRLRYRAATEDKNNHVIENLKIYFVEKSDGSSVFREVKVNEFGAILDWPEGFFDQSQFESESILRAAAVKRKRQRSS